MLVLGCADVFSEVDGRLHILDSDDTLGDASCVAYLPVYEPPLVMDEHWAHILNTGKETFIEWGKWNYGILITKAS